MRVLVDATPITPRLKGTGRFLVGLLRALPAAAPTDEFLAVLWRERATILAEHLRGVRVATVPCGSETVWELRRLSRLGQHLRVDAILTLRELVGLGGPPTLLHLAEPPELRLRQGGASLKHRAKNRLLAATTSGSLQRAAAVTASSEWTASWVEARTRSRPRVIPPGIDDFFFEPCAVSWDGPPFLLHPATGDDREHTPLVLEAFAASDARRDGVRLALSGTAPGGTVLLRDQIRRFELEADVDVLGWLSDGDLRCRYANALALVHPTRFEGFAGLQPLEAMAQGTPVIALEGPGVTEALEGAAELIERPEALLLAAAIDRVVVDPARRRALGDRGRTRVAGFTWAKSASAFAGILRSIAR